MKIVDDYKVNQLKNFRNYEDLNISLMKARRFCMAIMLRKDQYLEAAYIVERQSPKREQGQGDDTVRGG